MESKAVRCFRLGLMSIGVASALNSYKDGKSIDGRQRKVLSKGSEFLRESVQDKRFFEGNVSETPILLCAIQYTWPNMGSKDELKAKLSSWIDLLTHLCKKASIDDDRQEEIDEIISLFENVSIYCDLRIKQLNA